MTLGLQMVGVTGVQLRKTFCCTGNWSHWSYKCIAEDLYDILIQTDRNITFYLSCFYFAYILKKATYDGVIEWTFFSLRINEAFQTFPELKYTVANRIYSKYIVGLSVLLSPCMCINIWLIKIPSKTANLASKSLWLSLWQKDFALLTPNDI